MFRTILILSASPKDSHRLRLDQEVREIDEGLRRSRRREEFDIQQRWAVRPIDVHRALLDCRPQIVHFSGHGAGNDGIVLEDNAGQPSLVSAEALSNLFELFPGVECVLLNACYSEIQAKAIAQHVSYVVGMNDAIGDDAAISFGVAFYDAVGAGESYEFAFKIGCSAVQMTGIPEHLTPVLIKSPEKAGEQNVRQETYREFLERQDREAARVIANAIHSYAEEVVMELLTRLVWLQLISSTEEPPPSIAGRWYGMVNGRNQTVIIRQSGSVVYLEGTALGDSDRSEYKFRGEGRIMYSTLVFSWQIGDAKGINVMSLSRDARILDGRYYTSMGDSGGEIYHFVEATEESDD
jgi:hypothetical protein